MITSLGQLSKFRIKELLPDGFGCGIVYNLKPPLPDGIANVVGVPQGAIKEISIVLKHIL
jgi:hypothetical protein